MAKRRPKVAFVPISMKLFWQLYPSLEERAYIQARIVENMLKLRFDVISLTLAGDENEAEVVAETLSKEDFDLLIIWENGYVASGIPTIIIEALKNKPISLLITQRDTEIPLDMDYARYMESTATTSAMELGGALSKLGIPYTTIAGHMQDKNMYDRLEELARAAMVYKGLKELKIGSIGYAYPGMLDICVDDADIEKLGPKLIKITLEDVKSRLLNISSKRIEIFIEEIEKIFDTKRIKVDDFVRAAKTYCVIEDIIKEYEINALTVNDFEYLSTATEAVSDFALSMLENRYALATGVEGDIPNCIGAYIGSRLAGSSCMFTDWTMFDEKNNTIFLQHNGKVDPAIVDNPALSPSAEPFGGVVGDGVVVEASGKEGPVTLISMFYREGWNIFVSEGKAITAKVRPCRLNQMTVKLDTPVREFVEKACDLGVGHHLNAVHGHIASELKYLAKLAGIKYLELT